MRKLFTALLLVSCFAACAAEVIPPAPKLYFTDYAKVVSYATAETLNQKLADFERETSSQILVAVFPKMQSDSSIEDYTVRVAQSWKVGQKGKDNGAVLFVFTQDRKMYLQVGYGLEGALPDALCKRIIEDEIKPHFKNGNFDAGLSAGVSAILKATKGEYTGTGRGAAQSLIINGTPQHNNASLPPVVILFIVVIVIFLFMSLARRSRGGFYSSGGWSSGGGGWSGGSSGGGFSGGGGSFGGGGAGGSW